MLRLKAIKKSWLFLVVSVFAFIGFTQVLGQIFFVNHTESITRGIYFKNFKKVFLLGDILVFQNSHFKGNLIKYVAGRPGSEFCIKPDGSLWIDDNFAAQMNIQKYPMDLPKEPECRVLQSDEVLMLGEHPDSFDSRYFGPVKFDEVKALVSALYLFE